MPLDPEGALALVRLAWTTRAKRPVALGAATALVIWTPAKEEVAAIMVGVCAGMMSDGGNTLAKGRSVS